MRSTHTKVSTMTTAVSRIVFALIMLASLPVGAQTLVEDFADPLIDWRSDWLKLNSNLENHYVTNGYVEGHRGNNPTGLWISDGTTGGGASIVFSGNYGDSISSLELDVSCFGGGTTFYVTDKDGVDIAIRSCHLDNGTPVTSYPHHFTVTSTNGISGGGFRGTDVEGWTAIDNVTIERNGVGVDAGSTYTAAEGGSVSVTASCTFGTCASYNWDLDCDGTVAYDDATGQSVTFSAASLDGPTTCEIAVEACDASANCATDTASVDISNAAPSFDATPPTTALVGDTYSHTLTASDPASADTLTFSLTTGPAAMTLASETLEFTPSCADVGTHPVKVQVADDDGASVEHAFDLVVEQRDDDTDSIGDCDDNCPGVANASQADADSDGSGDACDPVPVAGDDAYTTDEDTLLDVSAPGVLTNDTDADTDTLSATVVQAPANGTLTLSTDGAVSYQPDANFSGTDTFTYVARDAASSSPEATVTLTVTPVNDPPVLVDPTPTGPLAATAGVELTFTIAGTDPDGDTLTYELRNLSTDATLDAATGAVSWTPTYLDAGSVTATLVVSDGVLEDTRDVTIDIVSLDSDDDGLPDDWETSNGLDPNSADSDGDGIRDDEEVGDDLDNPSDTDSDGTIDALDDDSDDDGILDADEAGDDDLATAAVDTDDDGVPDYLDTDSDDDGADDAQDNCRIVENPDQADGDGDGQGDACDDDLDGDTVADADDNCPEVANTDQADLDEDGTGDECDGDVDGDGVDNEQDNCLLTDNPDQVDTDGDDFGDACDDDDDDDGVLDADDACPLEAGEGDDGCPLEADEDDDGEPTRSTAEASGCGCNSTDGPAGGMGAVLFFLLSMAGLRARRRWSNRAQV
jgi:hypothetical protein